MAQVLSTIPHNTQFTWIGWKLFSTADESLLRNGFRSLHKAQISSRNDPGHTNQPTRNRFANTLQSQQDGLI
jgi:hypothetical protein